MGDTATNDRAKIDTATTMPLTVRMRRSPFWARSHAAGAKGYIVYNNMLLATNFASPEEDYRHLKAAVQVWDVGCERQIEIAGPDAARLVQMSTPRDLAKLRDDQCFYIPTVDRDGGMARVGKDNEAAALELDGVDPLSFTGRRMGGLVELDESAMDNDEILNKVLALARDFVESLPPK